MRYKNAKSIPLRSMIAIVITPFVFCRCGWFLPAWNLQEASGRGDIERVNRFLDEGADVNQTSVSMSPLLQALKNKRIETARLLVDRGADINYTDNIYGIPPIVYAVLYQDERLVKQMIERGADTNIRTKKYGNTALIEAARAGQTEIARLLIKNGAEVNLKSDEGFTALIVTAYHGHLDMARLLIEHGADPDIVTPGGTIALINAEARGHKELAKYLKPLTQIEIPEKSLTGNLYFDLKWVKLKAGMSQREVGELLGTPVRLALDMSTNSVTWFYPFGKVTFSGTTDISLSGKGTLSSWKLY